MICKCLRCGYEWEPKDYRHPGKLPKACPECKRRDWAKPTTKPEAKK